MKPLNHIRRLRMEFLQSESQSRELLAIKAWFLDAIEEAVKFTLPPYGIVLDDKQIRALEGVEDLRLPFPCIALEFDCPDRPHFARCIVVAREEEDHIVVQGAMFDREHDGWGFPGAVRLPKKGFLGGVIRGEREITLQGADSRQQTPDTGLDVASGTIVYQFLNALACSNVVVEKVEPSKLRQGIAKDRNALPYDTYHFLSVEVPRKAGKAGGEEGLRRTPREHLRRGHIRRLEDGRRIWVNVTVVSAGNGGRVFADYGLRAPRGAGALDGA